MRYKGLGSEVFLRYILISMVVGCGISEEEFSDQLAIHTCERNSTCIVKNGGEARNCEGISGIPSTIITCDYDGKAATECIQAIDDADCQGNGFAPQAVCATVLTNCTNSATD